MNIGKLIALVTIGLFFGGIPGLLICAGIGAWLLQSQNN